MKEKLTDRLSIVLIILLMAIFSIAGVMAHGEIVREGNILSQSKPEPINTGYMWKDRDGNLYPIYKILNKKGVWKYFILRVSKKTGKEYRYYLPEEQIVPLICISYQTVMETL